VIQGLDDVLGWPGLVPFQGRRHYIRTFWDEYSFLRLE
jgi:hypothetical protein